MECPQIPEIIYAEISRQIHDKAIRSGNLISSSIDITNSCNLRCVHCYIRDTDCGEQLTYEEICHILDQLADEGCLWLCITGGEPLVRPDFRDIYSYAKHKGFIITIFSNGTLLTPIIADFLVKQPPFVIDITLYGMTAETYEKVTGVPGSFSRCINGIELAVERHLPVKLKTIILTLNAHELHDMRRYAKRLGVGFRYDPLINAKVDGSVEPTKYRLSPEKIVSLEMADDQLVEELSREYTRLCGVRGNREFLYTCGAGTNNCHITSDGKLNLCTISRVPAYDLRKGTIYDGVHHIFPKILAKKRTRYSECQECPALNVCGQCPAWAELEHGDPEAKVEFLCQTAKLRVAAFRAGGLGVS